MYYNRQDKLEPINIFTFLSWLRQAKAHLKEVEEILLQDYRVTRGQLDAMWGFVGNKGEKNYPETAESGQFWRSTYLDRDTRLRVARGIDKNETLASIEVFKTLKRRGHPDGPPPTIFDGWGGIGEAMIEAYGLVPQYCGRGRPPTRKKPGQDWLYLQMVKQRDQHGHFCGTKLRAIYGSKAQVIELLGKSTAYIERSNLTSCTFNARQLVKPWLSRKNCSFTRLRRFWKIVTTIWCILTKVCACQSQALCRRSGSNELRQWLPI